MADSGDVVKRITITANGEGIDSTTSSINSLSDAFDTASDKSKSSLADIATLGAGMGTIAAAVAGLSSYIAGVNKDLADMATIANQVGLSLKDFQSIQFTGLQKGLSTDQINSGLEKSAQLLNDASRNSNSLSKEFDANGLSVKNANGQLITQNQLLTTAASLIANAKNPGDALAIAQMLGFTKEWIPLLEEVANQGMPGIAKAAQDAGAIISDETIQKASEFDDEWRKSSVAFSSSMKAALADLLPYLDDLIMRAQKFVSSIKRSDVEAASKSSFDQFEAQTGIPSDGVIHIDADAVTKGMEEFKNSPIFSVDTWINLGKALGTGFQVMSQQQASEKIPGYSASQITEPSYPTADQMDAAFKKSSVGMAAASQAANSKVASKANDANDALDRAINTLQRHTDQTKADADAVGLGAAALAEAKARAQEHAAVAANDGEETSKQAAQFKQLQAAAGVAADALAKANVASTISRGSQTAFLSPEDVQIANQLKTIFGDNIPAALNSSQAAALRMNNVLSSINTTVRDGATTFAQDFVGALVKGQSLMSALQTAASALGKTLLDSGLKTLVTDGLNALSGPASSLASSAGLTAGATTAATTITAAGTAAGQAIAAGAQTAAGLLGTGSSTAAGTLGASGTATGTDVATGGATAGAALDAGGAAAGAALWGPIAALAAAAAGIGLSFLGQSSGPSSADKLKADQSLQQQVDQQNQAAADRKLLDQQNGQLAGIDQTTLQGQLQAFDISSQQQREQEAKNGNGAIVELEQSLAAQRLAIIQKSNEAIEKTMTDFLNSLKTGSLSILSPQDQLAYEQNLFNTQLAGAKSGNSDDLNALTTTAQSLLTLAQNFYASGTGYAATYNQVTSALTALSTNVNQTTFADSGVTQNPVDVVALTNAGSGNGLWGATGLADGTAAATVAGMAEGGIVGNGIFNKDSVVARYSGGGNIALAGGEAITRATSVNANTINGLNYINRTGKMPSNNNDDVVRVLTQGFNGLASKLDDQTAALASRVKSLEDTTRQAATKRRVPGTKAA